MSRLRSAPLPGRATPCIRNRASRAEPCEAGPIAAALIARAPRPEVCPRTAVTDSTNRSGPSSRLSMTTSPTPCRITTISLPPTARATHSAQRKWVTLPRLTPAPPTPRAPARVKRRRSAGNFWYLGLCRDDKTALRGGADGMQNRVVPIATSARLPALVLSVARFHFLDIRSGSRRAVSSDDQDAWAGATIPSTDAWAIGSPPAPNTVRRRCSPRRRSQQVLSASSVCAYSTPRTSSSRVDALRKGRKTGSGGCLFRWRRAERRVRSRPPPRRDVGALGGPEP